MADVNVERGLAIISLPAVGLGMTRRLSKLTLHVIGKIYADDGRPRAGRGKTLKGMTDPAELAGQSQDGIDSYIALKKTQAWLPLMVGMVFSNRPARLVWDLKSSIAAAGAGPGHLASFIPVRQGWPTK